MSELVDIRAPIVCVCVSVLEKENDGLNNLSKKEMFHLKGNMIK